MNSITELLNLEDNNLIVSDISIEDGNKIITLETLPTAHYCPACGFRMYSKGIKKRRIKHPILQDNYELIIILKQRRWLCTMKTVVIILVNLSNLQTNVDVLLTPQIYS